MYMGMTQGKTAVNVVGFNSLQDFHKGKKVVLETGISRIKKAVDLAESIYFKGEFPIVAVDPTEERPNMKPMKVYGLDA